MEPESYIGVFTINLKRKELCIGWGKDFEELKTGEDQCFDISEPDKNTEQELEMLLRKAIIQSIKLNSDTIKIYLIDIL